MAEQISQRKYARANPQGKIRPGNVAGEKDGGQGVRIRATRRIW